MNFAVFDVDLSNNAPDHDRDAHDHLSSGRQPALNGCPWHDVNEMLQAAGLRPTRQRMALGWLLFFYPLPQALEMARALF